MSFALFAGCGGTIDESLTSGAAAYEVALSSRAFALAVDRHTIYEVLPPPAGANPLVPSLDLHALGTCPSIEITDIAATSKAIYVSTQTALYRMMAPPLTTCEKILDLPSDAQFAALETTANGRLLAVGSTGSENRAVTIELVPAVRILRSDAWSTTKTRDFGVAGDAIALPSGLFISAALRGYDEVTDAVVLYEPGTAPSFDVQVVATRARPRHREQIGAVFGLSLAQNRHDIYLYRPSGVVETMAVVGGAPRFYAVPGPVSVSLDGLPATIAFTGAASLPATPIASAPPPPEDDRALFAETE